MIARGRGLIVNISFMIGQKHVANAAYGVSKAAGWLDLTNSESPELTGRDVVALATAPLYGRSIKLKAMFRVALLLLIALPLFGQCRLPEIAPDAQDRMSPAQLVESGHFLRAARVLEPAVQRDPKDAAAAYLLSRVRAALGDLDGALKLAETAIHQDKGNADYHVQMAAVLGRMAEKANMLKQLSYAHRARQELDEAASLDPNNTEAQWGLMMYYFAVPPLIGGDKEKARQLGQQLALLSPDLGRYYQGRLAIELKETDAAENFYRQSAIENPLNFETVSALANFYIERKPDQLRAERWACQAVHAEPTRGDAWALLAKVYTMCGCWTEAIAVAERAEAIDPENLAPYYAISAVAIDRHQQAETAAALLKKYLSRPSEGNMPTAADAQQLMARLH